MKSLRLGLTLAVTGALAVSGFAAQASAATHPAAGSSSGYQFLTLDNTRDLTFNQLLGINNEGVIAGYFGSGVAGHPNKGYVLRPPFAQADFSNENYPHSVQTQVTGLNDDGVTVGFWSTQNKASQVNNNFGFYEAGGQFHEVNFPTTDNSNPPTDQLLGLNNHDIAVGFYVNGGGSSRGYEYNIAKKTFTRVLVPGAPAGTAGPSLTAAAINNKGDVAGFYAKGSVTDAFLRLSNGKFTTLAYPASDVTMTQAFGVNDSDEVVGAYTVGSGSSAQTFGFTWANGHFTSVSDPNGIGSTIINGVNNEGDLVGFYTDSAGNTDGLLALPGV
jgi:hypothetical protein